MMKNYFTNSSLIFCLEFLVIKKKGSEWKDNVDFKDYDVTT